MKKILQVKNWSVYERFMLQLHPLPFCPDASGLELFETPAARSFMEQSWAEVKKNTPPKMIDESVQEDDVNSAEEEDSENSNRPDTSCAEITEDEGRSTIKGPRRPL